ncbi:MAG: signal peptidase II [Candidatus Moranbacteria bacterium RBG_13_45_13]|nr:MAG: signal peptidase II [Candidatus Moranbacteria bacterium RBG_13_45_13]
MKTNFRFLFLLLSLVSLDQLSKFIFHENSICNKNIAWSIPIAPSVFYFLWAIIFLFLIYCFLNRKHFEKTALVFIISGGISNIIDRLAHGCVIDFIDIKIWPVFNLADVYITIGILMLLLEYIKSPSRKTGHQNF